MGNSKNIETRFQNLALLQAKGVSVVDVVRGVRYTAAFLDDGRCGLAFSFARLISPAEKNIPLVLTLPRPAEDLLALFGSSAVGDRAIATAVANAILNSEGELSDVQPDPQDVSEILMVGHIAPLAKHLVSLGIHPLVVDDALPDSLPLDRTEHLAARSDLLILSASTVVNGSWWPLSAAAKKTWLVGPSAPMCSAVYENTSICRVYGRRITDPLGLRKILSLGGGTRDLSYCTKKTTITLPGWPAAGDDPRYEGH